MAETEKGEKQTGHFETPPEERTWIDDPKNVDRLCYGLYGICGFLVIIDLFVTKDGYFEFEHLWGFYAWYGLIACVGLVLVAKVMRTVLMRPEDYYDR